MRTLLWDTALEKSAQEVAAHCKPSNDSSTSAHYMEVFFGMGSTHELEHPMFTNATNSWFHGRSNVTTSLLHSFQHGPHDREGKTYLQLIWANAEKVGCSFGNLKDTWTDHNHNSKPSYKQIIICHFVKSTNHVGQAAYKAGTQCTSCPSGETCSKLYPGLCGKH
jgi:hypothetical protein